MPAGISSTLASMHAADNPSDTYAEISISTRLCNAVITRPHTTVFGPSTSRYHRPLLYLQMLPSMNGKVAITT